MASDPMFKLEHSVEDKEKINDETPRIQLLQVRERDRERRRILCFTFLFQSMQEDKKDDFSINQILRKRFRVR